METIQNETQEEELKKNEQIISELSDNFKQPYRSVIEEEMEGETILLRNNSKKFSKF